MGCGGSKAEDPAAAPPSSGLPPTSQKQTDGGFVAFLSHFKMEAATEARWLKRELEERLDARCFLDSDDLLDLSKLRDHVRESKCVLMLQTRSVLSRPWCLVELLTAVDSGVPIIGVSITSGTTPYDYDVAAGFLAHLDTTLGADAKTKVSALGIDLTDAAFKLSNTLPSMISVQLNMNESRGVLSARVDDIIAAIAKAGLPTLPDKATWLASRGSKPKTPTHGWSGSGGGGARAAGAHAPPAAIPSEVPMLPASAVGRPEIIATLKEHVIASGGTPKATRATSVTAPVAKKQATGIGGFLQSLSNTTTASGMGGVGKTMTAAALVRDEDVRKSFSKICWVSIGQEPDTPALQQTLHIQLVGLPLPEAARADERVALEALRAAAADVSVLLVLDDVWQAAHTTPINFVIGSGDGGASAAGNRSAVVVTTRMRSLIEGAAEVQCGVLSAEASLELLLRAGGCEHLLGSPPPAAVEAVELCGRLPLALGLAGGIVVELADTWQTELVPLLKEEFEDASVEERVVTISLRVVPEALRGGVEGLFALFGVFAEDATVPAAALDVLAPLMPADETVRQAAHKQRQVRRWLQVLVKANILYGSVESGVSVHDLVRDCMIRRAEAAREGGVRAIHREAIPLLLGAFDAAEASAGYVAASLHWHVRQAQLPGTWTLLAGRRVTGDPLLKAVLTHSSIDIRKQGAVGIGIDHLRKAADACDAAGEHLEAAELMYAAAACFPGNGPGLEVKRAWGSLKLLEEAGGYSPSAVALEKVVLPSLTVSTAYTFGSAEHNELLSRIQTWSSGGGGGAEETAALTPAAVMQAEMAKGGASIYASFGIEGILNYNGPPTPELTAQARNKLREGVSAYAIAAQNAPDVPTALNLEDHCAFCAFFLQRQHAAPGFCLEDSYFGEGGVKLRRIIDGYDFDDVHPIAKGMSFNCDFFVFGVEALFMLLLAGDVAAARAGAAKVIDAHKRILKKVLDREAPADNFPFEGFNAPGFLGALLLLLGEHDMLRDFMSNSIVGHFLTNDEIHKGVGSFWVSFGSWKSDDGHCHSTEASYTLLVRGLVALLEGASDETDAALREWLPPPARLLHIAEYECVWRAANAGVHPAVLCATLYGERLGEWAAAAEVASGVLAIEAFNPLLRVQASRLLGRAKAELGAREAACEAAERAIAEAAHAQYAWLEMMALTDLVKWSEAKDAKGARERLRSLVQQKIAAPEEELSRVLGEGVGIL